MTRLIILITILLCILKITNILRVGWLTVLSPIWAGAIVGGADDTAAAKMRIMTECGIHVVQSPADIGKRMKEIIK